MRLIRKNVKHGDRLTVWLSLLLIYATVVAPLHACCMSPVAGDAADSVSMDHSSMHMAATDIGAASTHAAGGTDCAGVCSTCASCDGWQHGEALIQTVPVFSIATLRVQDLPDSHTPLLPRRYHRLYVSRGPPQTLS